MIQDVQKELGVALSKAHEALKRELSKLRAGRANPNLLDGIRVDYYGTLTPLAQMAHINVPEPRLLVVKPWDKTQVKSVEKALRESDLGLNPQVDGDLVRIPLPPLTEERRKEFVKIARKCGEDCKVGIRKARHDTLDMLTVLGLLAAYVFFFRPELATTNAVAFEAVKWAGGTAAVGAIAALVVFFVLAGDPARLGKTLSRLEQVLPSTLAGLLARVGEKFATGLGAVRRPGRLLAGARRAAGRAHARAASTSALGRGWGFQSRLAQAAAGSAVRHDGAAGDSQDPHRTTVDGRRRARGARHFL